MPSDAAVEYGGRLSAGRARVGMLSALDARLAYARLAAFALILAAGVFAWRGHLSPWAIALPVAVFVALVVKHARVIGDHDDAQLIVAFYERGLARIEDRWSGTGQTGDRFRNDQHPYANDLDLFGPGSLFELLSLARTNTGEETLAGWLTAPAAPAAVLVRQESVRELTPALELRESLTLAGAAVGTGVRREGLIAWAEAPPALSPPWLRGVALVITALVLAAIAHLYIMGDITPLYVMLAVQVGFSLPHARRVERLLHAASAPARDLSVLSRALQLLERERFASAGLRALQEGIRGHGMAASTAITRIARLSEMHDWQHNLIFLPIALLLMWSTHLAWALEAWRRAHGSRVRLWLRAVGELEALASISAYAYEHPADPFPVMVDPATAGGVSTGRFEGIGLAHPLLPAARATRNDVALSHARQLLVVSGSNMSGKSTLLRTVGVSAVLAQAGAPVRATSLLLTPLAVGATLRIQDSLQEGRSRFYAEITRVRELSDLARGEPPLLFLLDELFHGTNSHDRLVGATGVLDSLVKRGAIGLITTHDLALTVTADNLQPRAANVHFDDWFDGREMRFDYLMKPGPVTRSNALALMRAVGLDVGKT